jgi:predicted MFS family arabinose efflux permease
LAITNNLQIFEALSFLVGVFSVVPQILLPLAADLASPEHRGSAISIVLSGLLFGILIARVLSGAIANFTDWHAVYYMAIGAQCFVFAGGYLIIPDYPAKNKGLTYFNMLTSMAKYAVTEPKVIQAGIVNIASSACFTSYWVSPFIASCVLCLWLFLYLGDANISACWIALPLLDVRAQMSCILAA